MPHSSSAHPATLVAGIPAPPGYGGPVRATLADTLGRACAPAARIVVLPAHEARPLQPPARVRTLRGTLWLTVDGVGEDILLEAGETRHFDGRRRVLAYALGGDASFEVSEPAAAPSRGPFGWARALLARIAGRVRRARLPAGAGA